LGIGAPRRRLADLKARLADIEADTGDRGNALRKLILPQLRQAIRETQGLDRRITQHREVILAGGSASLRLHFPSLPPMVDLKVQATLPDGRPVPGIWITLKTRKPDGNPGTTWQHRQADGTGLAAFPNLLEGAYLLWADPCRPSKGLGPGFPGTLTTTMPVDLLPRKETEKAVLFELRPGGALHGTVQDGRGRPVPHALVRLRPRGKGGDSHLVTADEQGRFTRTCLKPGEYGLSLGWHGEVGPGKTVMIEAGKPLAVDLRLPPGVSPEKIMSPFRRRPAPGGRR
jgi:hypothetical protein